jgi:alpha-glycerophosphate oxidase/glycerol-3-phosphate dehydrogenase
MSSSLRGSNIKRLQERELDVLVVGGGINGAVAAAALAGRGVDTGLLERDDFASGVSSHSSNLAWGGIKYLESHEYLLVNKLCRSRNRLMRAYPSTVQEIRFLTTIQRGFRFWPFLVYLGSLLYWFMGRCKTAPPRYLSRRAIAAAEPVIDTANAAGGLEYSDAYLHDNDARFVFGFIRKALDYGCLAANYVSVDEASFENGRWLVTARDVRSGDSFPVRAKVLVNACGPWVDPLNRVLGEETRYHHALSKGIHLIVDRLTEQRRVLAFFASDGRLFFLIPMGPVTCIGTTDTQVEDPSPTVSPEDRAFVLDNVNALLKLPQPLTAKDIIAERVGVRPLAVTGDSGEVDWVQLSRKHVIETDHERPQLSIFGGKLTDCLNVGDEVAEQVAALGIDVPEPQAPWYGEPGAEACAHFMREARLMDLDDLTDSSSSEPLSLRFWRRYGNAAFELLERVREDPGSAELLIEGAEYTRCEIELTARREMIVTLEDFLRRRSKIELVVRGEVIEAAPGLREACRIFFGDRADDRLAEYFREAPAREHAPG